MEVFILLDRSGSMQVRWAETITMLNSYVNALACEDATSMAKITLMLFDKAERTETPIIRDAVPAFRWTEIDPAEAAPRGYTPLFDAIGRLTALVEQRNPDKAVITIITDGEENASTEMTREGARAALERLKSKGHQVVFLGADFNAFTAGVRRGRRREPRRCRWRAAAITVAQTRHCCADESLCSDGQDFRSIYGRGAQEG